MIEVLMDSNEQTSMRAKTLQATVEAYDKKFTWRGFAEIPVDIRFRDLNSHRTISVELKEPADLAASVISGHLAQQVIVLHEAQEPGFIVCTGSVQDVFNEIYAKSKNDRYRDFGIIKHFCSTSYSSGYPVFFYDMQWSHYTLSAVEDYFAQPSICEYLRKDKSNGVQVAMLCMVPGIGATTAVELIKTYGSIRALMSVKEEVLAETKINGRKLGKKAAEIVKVFK